jgi:4-amino-4-deoxychorismate lyase
MDQGLGVHVLFPAWWVRLFLSHPTDKDRTLPIGVPRVVPAGPASRYATTLPSAPKAWYRKSMCVIPSANRGCAAVSQAMPTLGPSEYLAALQRGRRPYHDGYYAMYSSLLGGMVVDPVLMQIPVDDHLVHRGDGVFDTCKCVNGAIFNLDAHLARIVRSADAIGIAWPGGLAAIRALTVETLRVGGRRDCSARVILARGPGGFGVSPYEPPAPALYILAYALGVPFMATHPQGARVRRSAIPAKPAFFAGVKNCNYLPNVLMKRESVDAGVDYVVGFDSAGHLTEGPVENAGIVTRDGELVFPRLENILAGTTMLRVVELAQALVATGEIRAVRFRDITEAEIFAAAEMLMVGTTINVVSVREYEGRPVGAGVPGPVGRRLDDALVCDIQTNADLHTQVF